MNYLLSSYCEPNMVFCAARDYIKLSWDEKHMFTLLYSKRTYLI